MKALIGGTGFIGTSLIEALVKSGDEILVVGRGPRPKSLSSPVAYAENDCADIEKLIKLLSDATEIIDLSYTTTPKTSFDNPMSDLVENMPRVVNLFEASKRLRSLRRFIVVSSGGTVYGKTQEKQISELHPTNPISPYGITKLTQEKYALLYHQLYGVPIIIARPGNAYGFKNNPSSSQGFISASISNVFNNTSTPVFGKEGATRDYIYVDDLAGAIVALTARGRVGEIYNIGTGVGTNNLQILETINANAKRINRSTIHHILEARPFDVPTNILDTTKIRSETGWNPKYSVIEGIKKTWSLYEKFFS